MDLSKQILRATQRVDQSAICVVDARREGFGALLFGALREFVGVNGTLELKEFAPEGGYIDCKRRVGRGSLGKCSWEYCVVVCDVGGEWGVGALLFGGGLVWIESIWS